MLFIDKLYTVVASTEEKQVADFQIRLNAEHTIFAAHFPGEPILPGACIVQMVAELATLWLGTGKQETLPIVKMSNLKFLAVISPSDVLDLQVKLEVKSQEEGALKIAARVRDVERDYSKLVLTFAV